MDSFGFGVFDVQPAYGVFDTNYTGATVTSGAASDSTLNSTIAGARDFLGLIKETVPVIRDVRYAVTADPAMMGTGANAVPVAPKKTIDPMLIIIGAVLFWVSKNA